MPTDRPYRRLQVVGALLILIGLALLIGGVMLAVAGGSPFYLLAGIGFVASGALLWRRSSEALLVYAVLLVAMLAWSLWEVGLDWWPLAARLDVVFVFGALLVLPWFARPLTGPRGARTTLAGAVVLSAIVAVAAGLRDPHDIAGSLPTNAAPIAASDVPDGEWHAYGRTAAGQRWSPLAQITPANVSDLQVAWQFRTGDVRGRPGDPEETTDEVTPLKIGSRLFLCTPHQSVIALDATTGVQAWRYDPKLATGLALQHQTCRGLSYQPAPDAAPAAAPASAPPVATSGRANLDIAANDGKSRADCGAKLFLATADGRLIALDPDTGAVCHARWAHSQSSPPYRSNLSSKPPHSAKKERVHPRTALMMKRYERSSAFSRSPEAAYPARSQAGSANSLFGPASSTAASAATDPKSA